MSKKSRAARCSRGSVQGVLRAPAEGEGGVAHREDLAATASATLERSTGTVAHGKRAARERRRRPAAPRSRAAGEPATRRRRAVGGACACRARSNGRRKPLVVVVRTPTPNYLRQASPDRGKYQQSYTCSGGVLSRICTSVLVCLFKGVGGRGRGTLQRPNAHGSTGGEVGRKDFPAVWRPQWHVQRPVAGWGRWCAVGIAAANLPTAGCNFRCQGGHVGMCGWARTLEDGRGDGRGGRQIAGDRAATAAASLVT